jgi:hypothetical protein
MENDLQQPPLPAPPKRRNKWVALGRKILIGALITYVINFVLLKTGWDSWETFSGQADEFAESMMVGSARLSPMNLWKSVTVKQHTYTVDNTSPYLPKYIKTGEISFGDKIVVWLSYYWYDKDGDAFWVGRIILILAIIFAFGVASEEYKSARDKGSALLSFPFNVILKFFVFLLSIGIFAILLYFVIKLLLAIVGGLVVIFTSLAAGGGILKLVVDEIKSEAADSSKKTIASSMLPFIFGKSKPKV